MSLLLALPKEVRRNIWRHLFTGIRAVYQHRTYRDPGPSYTFDHLDCPVLIFLVCRQAYDESKKAFFEEALIRLDNLVNPFYGTWSCPVTDPTLIQHAFVEHCIKGSGVITPLRLMTNLKSVTFEGRSTLIGYCLKLENHEEAVLKRELEDAVFQKPDKMLHCEPGINTKYTEPLLHRLLDSWRKRQQAFTLIYCFRITLRYKANRSKNQMVRHQCALNTNANFEYSTGCSISIRSSSESSTLKGMTRRYTFTTTTLLGLLLLAQHLCSNSPPQRLLSRHNEDVYQVSLFQHDVRT